MIVVSDTTPIISLMKIQRLGLLEKLFGKVVIPSAVYDELTSNILFADEAQMVRDCEFIENGQVSDKKAVQILEDVVGLDRGESEAIILAEELKSELLLMDERKGRRVAVQMGVTITGTIGILVMAFDEHLINGDDVSKCIDSLRRNGIRLSEQLFDEVREHIAEWH